LQIAKNIINKSKEYFENLVKEKNFYRRSSENLLLKNNNKVYNDEHVEDFNASKQNPLNESSIFHLFFNLL